MFLNYLLFIAITIIKILRVLIIIRIILSWLQISFRNRLNDFLIDTTEPLLSRIRSLLPNTGFLDFSPVIAIVLLSLLINILSNIALQLNFS